MTAAAFKDGYTDRGRIASLGWDDKRKQYVVYGPHTRPRYVSVLNTARTLFTVINRQFIYSHKTNTHRITFGKYMVVEARLINGGTHWETKTREVFPVNDKYKIEEI